jgi:hypothetical protein
MLGAGMTAAATALQAWETDKAAACARIERNAGFLKILLKIKNDPIFLGRWVRHHAKIVGLSNLVIFDNMSDDPDVLSLYRGLSNDLHVTTFTGLHNNIHDASLFPELYASLARSCEYFLFLDADEFLVLFDGQRYYDALSVSRFIERNRDVDVFPSAWLLNMAGSDTKFLSGADFARFSDGLPWGKPVLRSKLALSGYIQHNIQLDKSLYRSRLVTNLFLMHMVQLSAKQRVRANFYKLLARNFISPDDSLEKIAQIDPGGITDANIRLYVSEIRRLLPNCEAPGAGSPRLIPGSLELMPNGTISYYSEAERAVMASILVNAGGIADRALRLPEAATTQATPV